MNKPTADAIRSFLTGIAETPREDAQSIPAAKRASVYRMLTAVYANQTADEQACQTTNKNNGKGFTGCDAQILSDIAQKAARYGNLTGPQARLCAKKLTKYAKQIVNGYETHSKAAQAAAPAPAAVVEQAPQIVEQSAPQFVEQAPRSFSARKYDLLGNRHEKSRAGAKRRPVTLVDGVNTASELKFFAAVAEWEAEHRQTANHIAAVSAA